MRRVALTGGIATGKSHVRAVFDSLGVPTIDADVLAREAVARGTPALEAIVRRFGAGILEADGSLDRRQLASIVFADGGARRDLEAIVHPAVRLATDTWFSRLDPGVPVAIADIPLLYEVGRDRDFVAVVVAACEPATQLQRVMRRDSVTAEEARLRLEAQLPIAEKVRRADYVIRTDGTFEETAREVREVHRRLLEAFT